MKKFNILKNTFFLAILMALLSSCSQRYELTMPLAITSRQLDLKSEAGSTHIMVYSNQDWNVKFNNPVEWASLNKITGNGFNDFVFSYSANYGITRSVKIVLYNDAKTDTITIIQAGEISKPSLKMEKEKFVVSKKSYTLENNLTCNLDFCIEDVRAKATYYDNTGKEIGTFEVGSTDPAAWISAYSISTTKATFTTKINETGLDRSALVSVYIYDYAKGSQEVLSTMTVNQSRLLPTFTLSESATTYFANNRQYTVTATENNIWSSETNVINADRSWIHDGAVVEDGLIFSVDKNTSGATRSGVITVSYEDGGTTTFSVTQQANSKLTFEELRACTPGKFTTNDIIEGYVVSDPDSPNVCSSPQIGQYQFDRTENGKTAYFESDDANYGVMLKFASESDNTLKRYAYATINLEGATLEKRFSPERYIITGLKSSSIISQEEGTKESIPEKKRSIAQLSDSDIYTFVALQNLEILAKDGSYTNVSDGYTLKDEANPWSGLNSAATIRCDVAPLLCYDKDGKYIYMLTNMAATWRRGPKDLAYTLEPKEPVVPQGSGTFYGVIVADEEAPVRWGDLGKYQIRAMQVDDIALNEAKFSTTIVEWTWNDYSPAITPAEGGGTLDMTGFPTEEGGTGPATKTLANDYNNTYNGREGEIGNGNRAENMKGLIFNAAMSFSKQWYNFSRNEGEYFDIKFNTNGISASNLFVGIIWGHGRGGKDKIQAPAHWKVQYSTDAGANWSDVPDCDIVKNRSCVWWDNTSQDACPGFTEHIIKLPSSCIGLSDCRVRFKVADTVTDIVPATSASTYKAALGCEKGHMTASTPSPDKCEIVIGTLTVRFN